MIKSKFQKRDLIFRELQKSFYSQHIFYPKENCKIAMKKFISVILALTLLVGMTQCFVSAEESFSDSTFLQNIELSGINYSENMLKTAKPDDIKIINFSLFFSPDSRLLDSVNQRKLGDNMTIEVALETKDDLLFFQDVVAPSEQIAAIKSKAVSTLKASREDYLNFAQSSDSPGLLDEIESVDEWVQCSEFWPSRHPCEELPTYNADEINEMPSNYATTPTGVPHGIPANVFTTVGKWESVNNSYYPTLGYKAVTTRWLDTNDRVTRIVQWEYLYNCDGSLSSGMTDFPNQSVGIKIKLIGEYRYFSDSNKVVFSGNQANMRIEHFADRFYFNVYEKNTLGVYEKTYTVEQIREGAFLVHK